MKAVNEVGEAQCGADFDIRPPPPQEPTENMDLPPPRPPSPISIQNSNKSFMQSKESTTLQTLAEFKHVDKPLPELVPFPFKPEKRIERPKSCVTVPTPSKFIKGTMYHSDYESDLEGPIPSKWRSYCSDTEDNNRIQKYRKVKPKLVRKSENVPSERKPSPPCPHKWESHETIEKLEEQLRNKNTNFLEQAALLKSSKVNTRMETTTVITQDSVKISQPFNKSHAFETQSNLKPSIEAEVSKRMVTNNGETSEVGTTRSTTIDSSTTFSTTKESCFKESKNVATSIVTNRQTHVLSNDKAPEFEAVNFQTYDNPDGTKEHVLNIADEKKYPDHQMMVPDTPIENEQKNVTQTLSSFEKSMDNKSVDSKEKIICTETKNVTTVSESTSATTSNVVKNNKTVMPTIQSPISKIVPPSPPPPLPAKMRYNAITPSQSTSSQHTIVSNIMDNSSSISDEHSHSSQSTVRCVVREDFVPIKDKIKFLEQKMEERDKIESELENDTTMEEKLSSDALPQIDRNTPTTPTTPKIKPHEIPGAVRILPPAASSPLSFKFGSSSLKRARRSNSMEQYHSMSKSSPNSSPLTIPRSAQPSPLHGMSPFFRKLSEEYSNSQFENNGQQQTDRMENESSWSNFSNIDIRSFKKQPESNETGKEKLISFKEKLINKNMQSSSSPILSKEKEKHNHNVTSVDMDIPPRPPLPSEVTDYALTQSSSGEQLHTYRYSDTEFASSSMTELAYSSTSMERPPKTHRDGQASSGRHLEPSDSLDLSDGNVFSVSRKTKYHQISNNMSQGEQINGDREGLTESELESDPNHILKDDMFARKRQNRSPRQTTPTLEQKQSPKLSRASARSSRKESSKLDMDGYEADTDDTLSRQRRRSVKDLAKSFQEAENACPSPQPFKPRPSFMHDASDYEASDFEYQSR